MITESLAKSRWPDRDPIGQMIQFGNMDRHFEPMTIVGIVGDVRDRNIEGRPRPTLYASARQRPNRTDDFTVVIHGTADPAWLIGRAGEIVRALDPDVPPRFRTIEQVFATSLANRRFSLLLLSVFAGAALLLAVIGIYGVMSYVVTQRTQEMGVRLALGATPGEIARLVLGQGARLVVIGLTLGIAGAVAAHAADDEPAVRDHADRSGDLRRRRAGAGRDGGGGVSDSGVAGDARRSADGAPLRVTRERRGRRAARTRSTRRRPAAGARSASTPAPAG